MQISLKSAIIAALAVGGAIGAAGANAASVNIALPTSGNSSLIFWVNDVSTGVTYAQALTLPAAQVTGAGGVFTYTAGTGAVGAVTTYTGSTSFSVDDSGNTALTSFISSAEGAGNSLDWGITAGASATGIGKNIAIATTPGGDDLVINGFNKNTLGTSLGNASGLGYDVALLQGQTADSYNGTTSGIIGTPQSQSGTNTNFYGLNITQGNAFGTTSNLYAITNPTTTISTTKAVTFNVGTVTFSDTTDLLAFTANSGSTPPPVPLPPAIWLLGSGLLGLAGVARRRASGVVSV